MGTLLRPQQWRSIYNEYPSQYWVLVVSGFVDRLGGTMLYPFFSIYIAQQFDVGLTAIGYVFLISGIAGTVGSFFGGPITDRFGRKRSILIGLMVSASASIGIGLSPTLPIMIIVMIFAGFFGEIGGPAQQAMIADLIPEEQRAEAFGIMRVVTNMAWIVGPLLGGMIALQSYMLLFITDAVTSTMMAAIVLTIIRESYTPAAEDSADKPALGVLGALRSYQAAVRDRTFMLFVFLAMLAQFVYFQMYVSLPYWLVDIEGMTERDWSIILAVNATMVVLLQFPIMRRTKHIPPLLVLAVGTVFYAMGYSMYGIFSGLLLFVVGMMLITVGEMLFFPTAQAVVANLAPATHRGRYMAVYGLAFAIPNTTGTLSAGFIVDNYNPDLLWLGCGVVALVVAGAYYSMRKFGVDASGSAEAEAASDPSVEPPASNTPPRPNAPATVGD